VNLAQIRSAVPEMSDQQTKKQTHSAKTEPYLRAVKTAQLLWTRIVESGKLHGERNNAMHDFRSMKDRKTNQGLIAKTILQSGLV